MEKNIDVYGTVYIPKLFERYKYSAIKARHYFSRIVEKLYPLKESKSGQKLKTCLQTHGLLEKNSLNKLSQLSFDTGCFKHCQITK